MDRRSFLFGAAKAAVGTVVASTVDLDRLLWAPGQRTIFDLGAQPPDLYGVDYGEGDYSVVTVTHEHGAAFEPSDWLIREHLRHLEKQIKLTGHLVNREQAKVGETLTIRLPQRYTQGERPERRDLYPFINFDSATLLNGAK